MVERTDTKLFSFQMNLPPFLHLSLNKEIAFDVKGEILIARVNNDKNHDISCKLHVFFILVILKEILVFLLLLRT